MSNPVVKFFYVIWYLSVFSFFTVCGGVTTLVVSLFSEKWARYITNIIWAYVVIPPAGIRLETIGRENLPQLHGNYIVYANHGSLLDIPAVALATRVPLTWVAKASLSKIPFFGWAMARVHMLVDRKGSVDATRKMVEEASRRLKDGQILSIFPEGTRNRGDQPLLPFKKGAFILARHTKVPIVPVAIKNSRALWPANKFWPRPGIIRIKIGSPMAPLAGENLTALTERAQCVLLEMLTDQSW